METQDRYKSLFNQLVDKLYEQQEQDGTWLHVSLQEKPEQRPHYLSIVWLVPKCHKILQDRVNGDIGKWVEQWNSNLKIRIQSKEDSNDARNN